MLVENEADIIVKADNGAGIMATAVGDLIRIGKNWPPRPLRMSRHFRLVAEFGCVHCAFIVRSFKSG